MQGFDHRTHLGKLRRFALILCAVVSAIATASLHSGVAVAFSHWQASGLEINHIVAQSVNAISPSTTHSTVLLAQATSPSTNNSQFQIGLDQVDLVQGFDFGKVNQITTYLDGKFGSKGDLFEPGNGTNTVIGTGDADVIRGKGGGFNTVTTGGGRNTIILGPETTNRILDFDPAKDTFVLSGFNLKNIVLAQGKNPGKGGIGQPLDSVNNALVIDKKTSYILASLPFVKASTLSLSNFVKDSPEAEESFQKLKDLGFKTKRGAGQVTGTTGHDRLIGKENDFLYSGDDAFDIGTATGSGSTEFPFPTDSPGTTELHAQLKNGVLRIDGTYKDFQGFPLFSQGEKVIDPNAKILNGSDPVSLINNFLKVPQDVEGHPISGTHIHFSPAGDNRGSFADATVIRYFTNIITDAKSGKVSGEFHLTPPEQAALLAGDLYVNLHTNVGNGSGVAGFPTGENRINFNRNVIHFR